MAFFYPYLVYQHGASLPVDYYASYDYLILEYVKDEDISGSLQIAKAIFPFLPS